MTFENELKPPLAEALQHYGVMGMKWGVRKGKSVTGQSRFAGAKTQANDRMIRYRQKKLDKVADTKYVIGRKHYQKEILRLEKSNERIKNGEMKARDILNVYSTVGLTDLLFTKTPKKK